MARKPTTKRFVVARTNITTADGKFMMGDKVDLTQDEAKHFNELGYLAPDLDDFPDEEPIGDDGPEVDVNVD